MVTIPSVKIVPETDEISGGGGGIGKQQGDARYLRAGRVGDRVARRRASIRASRHTLSSGSNFGAIRRELLSPRYSDAMSNPVQGPCCVVALAANQRGVVTERPIMRRCPRRHLLTHSCSQGGLLVRALPSGCLDDDVLLFG